MSGPDPHERDDRDGDEHDRLDPEQGVLHVRGELDADVADPGHQHDPHDTGHRRREGVAGEAVQAEEQEAVLAGDLGQVGHDDDVRRHDGPAAHPPGVGPERAGRPGERRAAVGVDPVELLVGHRDEEHRQEREDHHRRRLQADRQHDGADRGGEAVRRCGGGDADHHAGHQAQRSPLQSLVAARQLGHVGGWGRGHAGRHRYLPVGRPRGQGVTHPQRGPTRRTTPPPRRNEPAARRTAPRAPTSSAAAARAGAAADRRTGPTGG